MNKKWNLWNYSCSNSGYT